MTPRRFQRRFRPIRLARCIRRDQARIASMLAWGAPDQSIACERCSLLMTHRALVAALGVPDAARILRFI
jgi:hypothetical protein